MYFLSKPSFCSASGRKNRSENLSPIISSRYQMIYHKEELFLSEVFSKKFEENMTKSVKK